MSIALALAVMALQGVARAHGGEEHTHPEEKAAAPVSAAGMQGEVLTSSATTGYFEVVAKYPATDAGADTRMRLFVADYATNAPIANAKLALSFSPAGAKVTTAPTMVSPGIYDLVVRFPEDTAYALVATVTAGQRTDFVEVRNLYAGDAAERFLADHGGATTVAVEEDSASWMLPAAIAALALAGVVAALALRRRSRRDTTATPEPAPKAAATTSPETDTPNTR